MFGTKVTTQILVMKTVKPDNLGYCVYVQADKILVLAIKAKDFSSSALITGWIKKLLAGNLDELEIRQGICLQGVYKQFSDPSIDIFIDEDGIGKGFSRTAVTSKGLELYGNLVILGSNGSETLLLRESQVNKVIKELGYLNQVGIEWVEARTDSVKYSTTSDHPEAIKKLIGALISYCEKCDGQLLCKAVDTENPSSNAAMVLCLRGDPEVINECHKLLENFINTRHESSNLSRFD